MGKFLKTYPIFIRSASTLNTLPAIMEIMAAVKLNKAPILAASGTGPHQKLRLHKQ